MSIEIKSCTVYRDEIIKVPDGSKCAGELKEGDYIVSFRCNYLEDRKKDYGARRGIQDITVCSFWNTQIHNFDMNEYKTVKIQNI